MIKAGGLYETASTKFVKEESDARHIRYETGSLNNNYRTTTVVRILRHKNLTLNDTGTHGLEVNYVSIWLGTV